MNIEVASPSDRSAAAVATPQFRPGKKAPFPLHVSRYRNEDESSQRQAEQFYLQKQIQAQTPMVIVLRDGQHIEGCIEWYDRGAIKVRGRDKVLVYKAAIKYMYKFGENAQ